MKRSVALLLSVLMIVCCIPSTLISTVLAVDPAFKPNGIRNQTFDDAYNQYIPETVTVDGKLDDTAWAYEDWNNVSTETGTWNKDFTGIGVNVYDYSYQYQFKTDYEYFYGAIKLNRQFYGDIVIWLNDGRWEYCTDRMVIDPTKLALYGNDGALTTYSEGATINLTALQDAVKLERNITSVLEKENTFGNTVLYEKNGAGAYIPAMKNPAANYLPNITTVDGATTYDNVYGGSTTDWVSLWKDVLDYSYEAEKPQYVIKQDGDAIIIEFRIYAYAFEYGKIEQTGELQKEDYNPNYTYYVSVGVGTETDYNNVGYYAKKEKLDVASVDSTTGVLTLNDKDKTKVKPANYIKDGDVYYKAKTKTYYGYSNGEYTDAIRNDNTTFCKYYVYTDCYYTDNGSWYRAALYYPRLNVTDADERANYIPSINYWPATKATDGALQGLKPEVMEMTDVPKNDLEGDSQMKVDGLFNEDIWSPLTNYHVTGKDGQDEVLDLSRVVYGDIDTTDNTTVTGQNAFKMEIRYDSATGWLYGAALAYVPAGGSIMPKLTITFHSGDSTLSGTIGTDATTIVIDANDVTYSGSCVNVGIEGTTENYKKVKNNTSDFWALRKKNETTQLWQFEFKVKVDGIIPVKTDANSGKEYIAYKANLQTGEGDVTGKVGRNAKIDMQRYFLDSNYYGTYVDSTLTAPTKSLVCNIENVIFDGKVDEYDWAALCAFDSKVSGMYQNDYIYAKGSATSNTDVNGKPGGNPLEKIDAITNSSERDMASFHKLTSDGEYLYGAVLVQFGDGAEDYWHVAGRPGEYEEGCSQADFEKYLTGAKTKTGMDSDLYRIWINNNPEHTNSLEREGATAIINIAVVNYNGVYDAYLFVGNVNQTNANDKNNVFAKIPKDQLVIKDGKLKGFALEFRVSLYAVDLKQTADNGIFQSGGSNVTGTYDINTDGTYYYNDRENNKNNGPYAVYYRDVKGTTSDGSDDVAVYENGFAGLTDVYNVVFPRVGIETDSDGKVVKYHNVTVYYDGTVQYITLDAYEEAFYSLNGYIGGPDYTGTLAEAFKASGNPYQFHEFDYANGDTTKLYNHVDYTQGTYFCYFVSIENSKDVNIMKDAYLDSDGVSLTYGRLISIRSADPLAVDAWTGHVYATYQNTSDKKWWRRNFFNVHIAHTFGYNDMLDYCVVDGKLEEHMWHRDDDNIRNMTLVTPTTGVWETTPTQNEVFEYTYRVWTDGNYVYGGAWLGDEIFKGKNEGDNKNCTKLELYFKNGSDLYYFDMYFRDDDEIVGTYQKNNEKAIVSGGLTDMLYQKTITYANGECYFEFRIDLTLLGCEYTPVKNSAYDWGWYDDRTDTYNHFGGENYIGSYNYRGIQYHIGMTQPCQTGAAVEVLTLFADNTRVQTTITDASTGKTRTNNVGDPYEMVRNGNVITWGTLNNAIRNAKDENGKSLAADYTTATMPSILKWDASDAMRVDQMEHFAGEKIRVDGTLNDTGWAEHRWLEVDRKVNGSEDVIFDDLNGLDYTYMVRSDKDYIYVSAVIDVEFNKSTRPEFYFWVLNGDKVDYIRLGYGSTTGGAYTPEGRDFDNSELYDVFDVEDIVAVYDSEDENATSRTVASKDKFTELAGRGDTYSYSDTYIDSIRNNKYFYEPADSTVSYENGKISFSTVMIETSKATDNSHGIDPFEAGLYGYSEVVQEMNYYFDIVNFGQVVGKEHALMQSANGVMINDRAGKKTETVVEFRVKKSVIDPGLDGFKYAVQASATFNGQVYDLVYPYVDNKVGERREMDDYNFPNSETIEVWQENAILVDNSRYERYDLRNNTHSVVTLGAKAVMAGNNENAIRFGSMYTENYIRNNVYAHTVETGDALKQDGYTNDKSNVTITTDYNKGEKNSNGSDLEREQDYWYWDTTKLGNIILPTWRFDANEGLNYFCDPTLAYLPATSIVTWKGDYSVGREINFADYESFQFYSAITDIPDDYTWIKYSFAAINGFDYVDKTKEADIGDGEHKVYHFTEEDGSETVYVEYPFSVETSYARIDSDGYFFGEITSVPNVENADYQGFGVTVNYYYDQILERSPYMINEITKGTEEDGDDSSNEESALPGNMNEGDYNGTKVAYIPLDNRPVNVERVQYLAEASGFDLIMPEEDMYRTATIDQSVNSNGQRYGNQEELLTWLREIEDSEDVGYYIISLDQIFFGGLAEAASADGRQDSDQLTDRDKQIIEYLGELADSNYVYYYTAVTPTVGLEGYAKNATTETKKNDDGTTTVTKHWWANETFVSDVAKFTEQARPVVTIDATNLVYERKLDQTVDISGSAVAYTLNADNAATQLDKVFANYGKGIDESGNISDITLTTSTGVAPARLTQIQNTRKVKMRLITEMLSTIDYGAIEHLVFGIEDVYSDPSVEIKNTIQANEVLYIQACVDALNDTTGKENYQVVKGVDHLGLSGISALTTDLYATQIPYFGNEAKKKDDVPKVVDADDKSLLWADEYNEGTKEGIDVKVEYITSTSTTSMDNTYTNRNNDYDELINAQIELAGGRRITDEKSEYLANATLVLLVLPDINSTSIKNFVSRAIAHLNRQTPVAMVAFGEYRLVADALSGRVNGSVTGYTNAIENPGRFLGTYTYNGTYKYRSTNSNAIGISISNAISRYAYLTGKRQTVNSHEGAYKVIAYSLINDISYSGNFNMDMDGEIYSGVHKNAVVKREDSDGKVYYDKAPVAYNADGKYNDTPNRHYSGLVKYADEYTGKYEADLLKAYCPQEIKNLVNKSDITVKVEVDWKAKKAAETDETKAASITASRHQNMANVMIGNARNPLDRPHELTFDVAVVENNKNDATKIKDPDNIALNKNDDGKIVRNRSEKYGTYFIDFYEYYYEEVLGLTASNGKYNLSGYDPVSGIPMGESSVGLPTTDPNVAGVEPDPDKSNPYYTYNKEDKYINLSEELTSSYAVGDLNYVISVTNNYLADNERDTVVNYKFSYGAELTDGLAYNYLEYTGKTHDERDYSRIGAFTLGSGYSNNGWFAFEKSYNCHYAGNDKYFGYVVVDLKDMNDIGAVRLHLLNYDAAEVHEPAEIRLLVSDDGTHFTYVDSFYTRDDSESVDGYWSMLDAKGIRGQYVKIEFVMGGQYALLNEIEVYAQDTQTIRVGTYNIAHGDYAQKNAESYGVGEGKTYADKYIGSIQLLADDIREADLDVVCLQEIAINTNGYTIFDKYGNGNYFDGRKYDNMVRELAKAAGYKYVYFNFATLRTDVYTGGTLPYLEGNSNNFAKMSGSAILTNYEIVDYNYKGTDVPFKSQLCDPDITDMTDTTQLASYASGGAKAGESAVMSTYHIYDNGEVRDVNNYEIVVLKVPANGSTMYLPIRSAHCNPQTLQESVVDYLYADTAKTKFYDNLIVAGDFNNPTFSPLHDSFPGMKLTVNDTNKLITYYQGKSMDNIIYSSDDYSLVASGTVPAGNSDHYLVWAELEYYEWIK